jgi:hypothetical protein
VVQLSPRPLLGIPNADTQTRNWFVSKHPALGVNASPAIGVYR